MNGTPGVVVYLDDSGKADNEHMVTLETVLQRLTGAGLHLKRNVHSWSPQLHTYVFELMQRKLRQSKMLLS